MHTKTGLGLAWLCPVFVLVGLLDEHVDDPASLAVGLQRLDADRAGARRKVEGGLRRRLIRLDDFDVRRAGGVFGRQVDDGLGDGRRPIGPE